MEEPPPLDNRRAWRVLATRIESERLEGWRIHRPTLFIYRVGLLIFGVLGGTATVFLIRDGYGVCPFIGAMISGILAFHCLASNFLVPRSFLLLGPRWLYIGRALGAARLVPWSEVQEVDLRIATNPRGTQETYGILRLLLSSGQEVKIDQFDIEHLRLLREELESYRQNHQNYESQEE